MSALRLVLAFLLVVADAGEATEDNGPPIPLATKTALPFKKPIEFRQEKLFSPESSTTFQVIEEGSVNLHFLDKTHLTGFAGQDYISIGPYVVESRIGCITGCNSQICNHLDGILGFGYKGHHRSPALLKTLTQMEREDWGIKQPYDFQPMPRLFAFTATNFAGELMLGDYDKAAIEPGTNVHYFPMHFQDYGVMVSSVTYGQGEDAVELLNFANPNMGYVGKFDSGTTCILMPNTTLNGQLTDSPFQKLLEQQLKGVKKNLYYTMQDEDGKLQTFEIEYEECVEPTNKWMILGDPWFRKYVVIHDLKDRLNTRMGLGLRSKSYQITDKAVETDYISSFANKKTDDGIIYGTADEAEHDPTIQRYTQADVSGVKAQRPAALKPLSPSATAMTYPQKLRAQRHKSPDATGSMAMLSELLESLAAPDLEKVRLETNRIVYTVQVGVGTPPQERKVVFDTGSYMLAIFSKPVDTQSKSLIGLKSRDFNDESIMAAQDLDPAAPLDHREPQPMPENPVVALQVRATDLSQGWVPRSTAWALSSVILFATLVVGLAARLPNRRRSGWRLGPLGAESQPILPKS